MCERHKHHTHKHKQGLQEQMFMQVFFVSTEKWRETFSNTEIISYQTQQYFYPVVRMAEGPGCTQETAVTLIRLHPEFHLTQIFMLFEDLLYKILCRLLMFSSRLAAKDFRINLSRHLALAFISKKMRNNHSGSGRGRVGRQATLKTVDSHTVILMVIYDDPVLLSCWFLFTRTI